MKKLLIVLIAIPFLLTAQNFTDALVKSIPGKFKTLERNDGSYKVDYSRGTLDVQFILPGKPTISQDSATYISTAPIVQLSFMTLPNADLAADTQAKVILNSVKNEYSKIGLSINEIRLIDQKKEIIGGVRGESSLYLIELSNGIREYLTVKVVTVDGIDTIAFTRVILSPEESENIKVRVKGNSLAANYFRTLSIK